MKKCSEKAQTKLLDAIKLFNQLNELQKTKKEIPKNSDLERLQFSIVNYKLENYDSACVAMYKIFGVNPRLPLEKEVSKKLKLMLRKMVAGTYTQTSLEDFKKGKGKKKIISPQLSFL